MSIICTVRYYGATVLSSQYKARLHSAAVVDVFVVVAVVVVDVAVAVVGVVIIVVVVDVDDAAEFPHAVE